MLLFCHASFVLLGWGKSVERKAGKGMFASQEKAEAWGVDGTVLWVCPWLKVRIVL